jgi:hypothetical protein
MNREDLIAEFHQLCCRQFALIIKSLNSIIIQISLVRDLESTGDEAPITSSELHWNDLQYFFFHLITFSSTDVPLIKELACWRPCDVVIGVLMSASLIISSTIRFHFKHW